MRYCQELKGLDVSLCRATMTFVRMYPRIRTQRGVKRPYQVNSPEITRRRFLIGFGAAGLLAAVTADATLIEPRRVVVERVEIRLARLPNELDGLTVAHLSDFHHTSSSSSELIREAVRVANGLSPDIVVLTGDYVTNPIFGSGSSAAQSAKSCAQILSELHAPMGVFAVLGNHDQGNPEFIIRSLETSGITVLRNYPLHVERSGARLWIAGVDDVLDGKARLSQALQAIPRGETTVLLAHEPDYADLVRGYPVDLQLSGHSHGGQVRFPLVGAPVLPRLARKYPWGLRQLGSLTLYTNRGIGTTNLPVRLNWRPK